MRIGDVDVRDIPQRALMERVAFVFQNERLFKQSIADNIRAARPGATHAEVEAAAHAAQCDDNRGEAARRAGHRGGRRRRAPCPAASGSAWPWPAPS